MITELTITVDTTQTTYNEIQEEVVSWIESISESWDAKSCDIRVMADTVGDGHFEEVLHLYGTDDGGQS